MLGHELLSTLGRIVGQLSRQKEGPMRINGLHLHIQGPCREHLQTLAPLNLK